MPCNHNFEDFWATGYDKCLLCGVMKRSRVNGVLTHLIDPDDGSLYPNPRALDLFLRQEPSRVRITLYLASGEVIENL